jgi:hypothetical protein
MTPSGLPFRGLVAAAAAAALLGLQIAGAWHEHSASHHESGEDCPACVKLERPPGPPLAQPGPAETRTPRAEGAVQPALPPDASAAPLRPEPRAPPSGAMPEIV